MACIVHTRLRHAVRPGGTNLFPPPATDIEQMRNCKAQFCLPFPVRPATLSPAVYCKKAPSRPCLLSHGRPDELMSAQCSVLPARV